MMRARDFLRAMGLCAVVVTSGCATHEPAYHGAIFLNAPVDISTAWLNDRGDLCVVPEKGVVIDRVVNAEGREVTYRFDGSYLLFPVSEIVNSSELRFLIEKRWRKLPLDLPKNRRFSV
jgi:hypothetical protein